MDNIPNMWKVLKFHGSSHHQPVNLTKITSFAEILHDIPGMMKPPSGVVCSARIDLEKTWKNCPSTGIDLGLPFGNPT
jgi:hypothetical protein